MKSLRNQLGFSLVEMAVVIAILGIVFAGYMVGFGSFSHSAKQNESHTKLVDIKKQILNFGMINKYLPCPDINGDGIEDRSPLAGTLGVFDTCTRVVGTVPFRDVGLESDDVDDGWGNPIRYAVNLNADDPNRVCDKTNSASMFCNAGAAADIFWFNLLDTPPTAAIRGDGNYFVCNDTVATCSISASASQLETDTAVVVLVAYNEDGAKTLSSVPSCSSIPAQNVDNCNADAVYHQREITRNESSFFDDVVLTISGYEVKAGLLSKNISWNSFEPANNPPPLTPTYTNFDISSAEYQSDSNQIETTGADVVLVNRNVSENLNLGDGDDYIAIGNDLESTLNTGDDDDTAYIVGLASGAVLMGDGDDQFVLGTDLTNTMNSGEGNDKAWIQGNVEPGSSLEMGADNDVVWLGNAENASSGNVNEYIDGGSGEDILVLERFSSESEFWAVSPSQFNNIGNFEYILFAPNSYGERAYCVWGVDCDGVNN